MRNALHSSLCSFRMEGTRCDATVHWLQTRWRRWLVMILRKVADYRCGKTLTLLSFPRACLEPVLVNRSISIRDFIVHSTFFFS